MVVNKSFENFEFFTFLCFCVVCTKFVLSARCRWSRRYTSKSSQLISPDAICKNERNVVQDGDGASPPEDLRPTPFHVLGRQDGDVGRHQDVEVVDALRGHSHRRVGLDQRVHAQGGETPREAGIRALSLLEDPHQGKWSFVCSCTGCPMV